MSSHIIIGEILPVLYNKAKLNIFTVASIPYLVWRCQCTSAFYDTISHESCGAPK